MADDPRMVAGKILVGKSDKYEYLTLSVGNRHGLITGATGTGKTVTLQTLAEGFSNAGVPVFAADIKGDLSGIAMPGSSQAPFVQRAKDIGVTYQPDEFPVTFWDLFGEAGHPIRATISEMGPLLTSRLLECTDAQEGVINVAFRVADEQGLLLLDIKDLRAMLQYVSDNAGVLKVKYGNIASTSVGAIQRQLLVLENQGATQFFGEPALDLMDFIRTDRDGQGMINILSAQKLMNSPRLYATFLLWMLSELFEKLPEVGDLPKPKLVFFFDEAHLLFDDAPKALLDSIERVVRLIRSKGVGIYFVTQNPLDIPDTVLGQLGNRVQHALRAFTPRDQRAVRAAAETFRQTPGFDTVKAIMELKVGEALVSMLDEKGMPSMVTRAYIAPPSARVGAITPAELKGVMDKSTLRGKYDTPVDRESAFEMLNERANGKLTDANAPPVEAGADGGILGQIGGAIGGMLGGGPVKINPKTGKPMRQPQSMGETIVKNAVQSAARSLGTQVMRAVLRGVLGGILGGGGRRFADLPNSPNQSAAQAADNESPLDKKG
jgi:DNA helicase HerA-like ATPase